MLSPLDRARGAPGRSGTEARQGISQMAEVLVAFNDMVLSPDGLSYAARACGSEMDDGRWQGWIEFDALDGSETVRSPRETTQPNRTDTEYWATGLTPVYLEGALERALRPATARTVQPRADAAFDGPRPTDDETAAAREAVLNPFSVYRKSEALLRRQLMAFSSWHLVNIITAYGLSDMTTDALNAMSAPELIEVISVAVRDRVEAQP